MTIRQAIGEFAKRHAFKGRKQLRATVPNMLTLGNACFGFLSIMQALQGNVVVAAYCILMAAVFDFLDGRIARYLVCVTHLGSELDSLCDAVSFCVAPATLMYSYCLQESGVHAGVAFTLYLCAGLFRLAKFNIATNHSGSFFSGLPTPMAACFLASIIMHHSWIEKQGLVVCVLPKGLIFLAVFIALLMVSSIPFPSFKRYKITHRYGLPLFFIGILCLGVGLLRNYPVLLFMSSSYILITIFVFFLEFAIRWKVSKF